MASFRSRSLPKLGKVAAGGAMLSLAVAACGSSGASSGGTTPSSSSLVNASSHPGITASSVTVGMVASLTGPASSSFGQACVQGAQAAFNQINAKGGVYGRKLKLVTADDASSTTQDLTAVQSLISRGVFGILVCTPEFFAGYRATVSQGIPVTGDGIDGPEWSSSKYQNLFGAWGSDASNYPTFTTSGKYFKQYGVTKLGVVSASDSPSAQGTANAIIASAKLAGIPTVVKDYSQPIGSTNYTATAVAMKNAGVNGVATEQVTDSNVALITALKQQGVKLKAEFISGGYQQAMLESSATVAAMQGLSFQSQWAPADLDSPATKAFVAALATVGYRLPNPAEGQTQSYFPALTFIKGLQVAGKNPTWGSFITGLHSVHNYTANGLIAPVNYAKHGNVDPNSAGNCWYISVLKGDAFTPLARHPFCGTEVLGTSNGS
jgi:branched-chain amino acid transport system substrate-binding protein